MGRRQRDGVIAVSEADAALHRAAPARKSPEVRGRHRTAHHRHVEMNLDRRARSDVSGIDRRFDRDHGQFAGGRRTSQRTQREDVRARQIDHMNIVAHAGAVWR